MILLGLLIIAILFIYSTLITVVSFLLNHNLKSLKEDYEVEVRYTEQWRDIAATEVDRRKQSEKVLSDRLYDIEKCSKENADCALELQAQDKEVALLSEANLLQSEYLKQQTTEAIERARLVNIQSDTIKLQLVEVEKLRRRYNSLLKPNRKGKSKPGKK